ncbi:DUF29 domain-containing protein [Aphanothece hegewaldii CCALA 016]|uniref:DUF29 domain-containing protein n=1 Tax=Aphanothece hegewaldii CCALA 016 TaxID=2107694 RepID=A0A2T1M096_9CHRO|nr:DUF29 domain-containing protein [Aphanothece hegewaldii]PSF38101.1 DUF29 domain-containing protein [Aphanothece hegewaldii CCALA 016]
MTAQIDSSIQTLYEQDYQLWLKATLEQLRQGKFSLVDWKNLIEELETMGKSDKRAIKSLLTRLFEHLLKLAYWEAERAYNSNKWKSEITTFRVQIKELLKDSPSLKPYLFEVFEECYQNAREIMARLMGCKIELFPAQSTISIEQALDNNWFPMENNQS